MWDEIVPPQSPVHALWGGPIPMARHSLNTRYHQRSPMASQHRQRAVRGAACSQLEGLQGQSLALETLENGLLETVDSSSAHFSVLSHHLKGASKATSSSLADTCALPSDMPELVYLQ